MASAHQFKLQVAKGEHQRGLSRRSLPPASLKLTRETQLPPRKQGPMPNIGTRS